MQQLADAWKGTPACEALEGLLAAPTSPPLTVGSKPSWTADLFQLRALIARAAMNSVRDPAAYALRCPGSGDSFCVRAECIC